jgi:SAM-dependent methyltransferase
MDEWVRTHIEDVPRTLREFCGDMFRGKTVLDVGCADMLGDFPLLELGVESVTGIDIQMRPDDVVASTADKIRANGFGVPDDFRDRLNFVHYNGRCFPFHENSFDVVFSWSSFEHIWDPRSVLHEMHRVLRPDGFGFIQVYPWYGSLPGSHLTDWIDEPFFHLTRTDQWVKDRLVDYTAAHPEVDAVLIDQFMFLEYCLLNRMSSSRFYALVRAAGFNVTKCRLLTSDEDLSQAPIGVELHDLMVRGTMMLLSK